MTTSTFFIPSVNMIGAGCLAEAATTMKGYGYKHALIVTDNVLNKIGVVAKVQTLLSDMGIKSAVYDGTHPNPTTINVAEGLEILRLRNHGCHLRWQRPVQCLLRNRVENHRQGK